jgi:hypothetical protein
VSDEDEAPATGNAAESSTEEGARTPAEDPEAEARKARARELHAQVEDIKAGTEGRAKGQVGPASLRDRIERRMHELEAENSMAESEDHEEPNADSKAEDEPQSES